jgi:hypothetical protein
MPKYQEIRPEIRSGDLFAWSHTSWKSWYDIKIQAVRLFTQSEYCHVGIAWVIGGRVFALEAVQPKVRIFPLSKLTPFYWLPMNAPWDPKTEEYALSIIGEPYSQEQAVAAFINMLKTGKDANWQCAEYVHEVLKTDGIDLGKKATPNAIVLAAQERPDVAMHYVTP